jgi:hypothetical protein
MIQRHLPGSAITRGRSWGTAGKGGTNQTAEKVADAIQPLAP